MELMIVYLYLIQNESDQIFVLTFFLIAEEKISKRLEDSLPPEIDLSPAAKDQVEMYVAFLKKHPLNYFILLNWKSTLIFCSGISHEVMNSSYHFLLKCF